MNFAGTLITPKETRHPDALVMYAMPIFGTIQNTGSRLQETANVSGLTILASDLYLQNKRTIFDLAARDANQPSGETYITMSQRRADFYTNAADRFGATTRVGMGDSLGVSAIQGMQLHGETEPFNALLLRDGWNLDEPTTSVRGIWRYLKYQIKDTLHQRHDKVHFNIPATPYEDIPKEKDETTPVAKMRNVADIMRGTHNRDNAVRLAGETAVLMNVVTLTDGLSATNVMQQDEFNKALRQARQQLRGSIKQSLVAKRYPGWHSDLLDPIRASRDLNITLDLFN